MAKVLRKESRDPGWRWLFRPEDTTAAVKRRVDIDKGPAGYLKTGLWIIVSILAGLAIGQL